MKGNLNEKIFVNTKPMPVPVVSYIFPNSVSVFIPEKESKLSLFQEEELETEQKALSKEDEKRGGEDPSRSKS